MSLQLRLQAYAARVNSRLDQLLPAAKTVPAELHEAMRYSCLAPGKRLRPAMCMASAEAVGAAADHVIDAACAVEMVHCFSLIHDDLPAIDDDDLRRGLPTCHKRFGEAIAILAGDALFSLAFRALACADLPGGAVLRSVQVLTKASGSDGLVGGEVVDVLSEGLPIERGRLEFIHSRKTGSLMAASCEIGGTLGGGSAEQVEALQRFGTHLGLAFQIADDILNETADAVTLGKSVGSDRERKKATYTALYGIEGARELAAKTVEDAKRCVDWASNGDFLRLLADFTLERVH